MSAIILSTSPEDLPSLLQVQPHPQHALIHTPPPLSPNAPKRIRSCLSPTRYRPVQPYGIAMSTTSTIDEPSLTCSSSPMTSRSASFSSTSQEEECWRRNRSVRWDEVEGSVMAAYYSTWSADDYDRSPLEPPKPEERACIMPARGSRCLSPLDCFTDSTEYPYIPAKPYPQPFPIPAAQQEGDDEEEADEGANEQEFEEDHEDKEWEECMERRRMMFAQMCRPALAPIDKQEEGAGRKFEGYTSISASLVAMLASSGIGANDLHRPRDAATPVGTPVEVYEEPAVGIGAAGGSRPKMIRVEHRLRTSFAPADIVPEEDEVEEPEAEQEEAVQDELAEDQPSADVVFAALRAFRMGPSRELRSGAEERDRR